MDIVIGTIRWIIDHQEVRDHLSVISFEQDVYQSHWKREKKFHFFVIFKAQKMIPSTESEIKAKGGGYHPVFSCYLTRLNMPLWNRAQMAQTGLDAFTRKHVCWIGASNTFRPAAGCWHRLNFHFRSNVTESCTRTAFCVHQKKKKCCVHQWYVNIFDCVLVSNDNRDCSLKLLCDDFFWLLNSSLSVTDKYCFYRVQLYPSSIKSPWTFIQSYQCYNPCSKMNVL